MDNVKTTSSPQIGFFPVEENNNFVSKKQIHLNYLIQKAKNLIENDHDFVDNFADKDLYCLYNATYADLQNQTIWWALVQSCLNHCNIVKTIEEIYNFVLENASINYSVKEYAFAIIYKINSK